MVSDAQRKASKRYDDEHKEMKRYVIAKSTSMRFAKGYGKNDDLKAVIKAAQKTLKNRQEN